MAKSSNNLTKKGKKTFRKKIVVHSFMGFFGQLISNEIANLLNTRYYSMNDIFVKQIKKTFQTPKEKMFHLIALTHIGYKYRSIPGVFDYCTSAMFQVYCRARLKQSSSEFKSIEKVYKTIRQSDKIEKSTLHIFIDIDTLEIIQYLLDREIDIGSLSAEFIQNYQKYTTKYIETLDPDRVMVLDYHTILEEGLTDQLYAKINKKVKLLEKI